MLVADEASARRAAAGGATVVQLRLKGAPTADVVALGVALADLDAELIVDDDVDAALELGVGVHLGQADPGLERARESGIPLGVSVTTRREGAVAEFSGATYLGAGPIWETPSKPDAAPPIATTGTETERQTSRRPSSPIGSPASIFVGVAQIGPAPT